MGCIKQRIGHSAGEGLFSVVEWAKKRAARQRLS
jgi:hypothetical protein